MHCIAKLQVQLDLYMFLELNPEPYFLHSNYIAHSFLPSLRHKYTDIYIVSFYHLFIYLSYAADELYDG